MSFIKSSKVETVKQPDPKQLSIQVKEARKAEIQNMKIRIQQRQDDLVKSSNNLSQASGVGDEETDHLAEQEELGEQMKALDAEDKKLDAELADLRKGGRRRRRTRRHRRRHRKTLRRK